MKLSRTLCLTCAEFLKGLRSSLQGPLVVHSSLGRVLANSSTRKEFFLVSCHDRGLQLSKTEMAPDIPAGEEQFKPYPHTSPVS